jgi:hypothetical protein
VVPGDVPSWAHLSESLKRFLHRRRQRWGQREPLGNKAGFTFECARLKLETRLDLALKGQEEDQSDGRSALGWPPRQPFTPPADPVK